jgi:hypothetical protein
VEFAVKFQASLIAVQSLHLAVRNGVNPLSERASVIDADLPAENSLVPLAMAARNRVFHLPSAPIAALISSLRCMTSNLQ